MNGIDSSTATKALALITSDKSQKRTYHTEPAKSYDCIMRVLASRNMNSSPLGSIGTENIHGKHKCSR